MDDNLPEKVEDEIEKQRPKLTEQTISALPKYALDNIMFDLKNLHLYPPEIYNHLKNVFK